MKRELMPISEEQGRELTIEPATVLNREKKCRHDPKLYYREGKR